MPQIERRVRVFISPGNLHILLVGLQKPRLEGATILPIYNNNVVPSDKIKCPEEFWTTIYSSLFFSIPQCKKDENLRKHMLLLWQNNVPVSIEVLLCSNCRVSQQKVRSIEFSTIPEPGSILLEQWTVSIQNLQ